MVDLRHLSESNVVKYYYTLIPSVTHLVLGRPPKRHIPNYYRFPGHADFAILHEFRHQNSPDSSSKLLFPSLEILEALAYHISGVTDIMLLEFIKARIDATKSNADVSKLKKVFVEFQRTRQTDIVPEALAYAQAAGIKLELELTYYSGKDLDATWSPSFGLSPEDVSWVYPLYGF